MINVEVASRGNLVLENVRNIGEKEQVKIIQGSPLWLNVNKLPEKYIELTAPSDFMQDNFSDFSITWIDFYRN